MCLLVAVTWVTFAFAAPTDLYTLRDLINPTDTQRSFDTLSASVAEEYRNRVISYDATRQPTYEARPFNLTKLNEKYRDILYEGDMAILPERLERLVNSSVENGAHDHNRTKRKAFVNYEYPSTIWSEGVPYNLHYSLSSSARSSIARAIAFWQAETCIDFRPRRSETQYVDFIGNDSGCWSTVGRDASLGRQVVSIAPGCEHFGVTSHELAHALGVFHEQSRYDRDNVVQLNTGVVDRGLLFNFAKIGRNELSLYNLPYDVGSVMHYTPTEFSRLPGVPALTTIDPNLQSTMGQLEGPSFLDIAILNRHYNCAARCPSMPCQNGGIVDSRTCRQCKCPSGFGGVYCEQVAPSFSNGCGGVISVQEAVRRFEITIRQIGQKREKQCVYHLQAPSGKRVLVNVLRARGRCVEGCWIDGAEFKMQTDYRPVGYRICCGAYSAKRMLSNSNIVPFIITSRNDTSSITFEYTFVNSRSRFAADHQDENIDSTQIQPPNAVAEDAKSSAEMTEEILKSIDMKEEGISTTISRIF